MNGPRGKRCDMDEAAKLWASGSEHINRARGKRREMDKRRAAASRELGSSSQKLGNPSDLDLLQKTFDRMK